MHKHKMLLNVFQLKLKRDIRFVEITDGAKTAFAN